MPTKTKPNVSPIDKYTVSVLKLIDKDKPNSEIIAFLEKKGVKTTGDSIRRFKQRHGVTTAPKQTVHKSRPATTKASKKAPRKLAVSIIESDGKECITYFDGKKAHIATEDSHPNFAEIKAGVKADDPNVLKYFTQAEEASKKFERLTPRITVKGGQVYVDQVCVTNAVAAQLVRYLKEGIEDWQPLALFLEKLASNPEQHSREQAARWLSTHKFSITSEGNVIGYRSIEQDWTSLHAGPAIVDDVEHTTGKVPNKPGSTISMARDRVNHDPKEGCSTGLHVGNWAFTGLYSGKIKVVVEVNPMHIVSVPTEANDNKMRVCEMKIIKQVTQPYTEAVVTL